jgi:hypothetical protein
MILTHTLFLLGANFGIVWIGHWLARYSLTIAFLIAILVNLSYIIALLSHLLSIKEQEMRANIYRRNK